MKSLSLRFTIFLFILFPHFAYNEGFALTQKEEEKYGREIHREIARSAKLLSDALINMYVEQIKRKLENQASSVFPLKVTVIESRYADAFSTFGGHIYITTGLIELCKNDSELAGVLAHEIAHVTKRHLTKRLEKEKYINIGKMATVFLGMVIGNQKTTEAIMASGFGALEALSLAYSREDELEADSVGTSILQKAGFSCTGIADFLKRLRMTSKDVGLPQYLLTHPYNEERISRLNALCKKEEEKKEDSFFPYLLKKVEIMNNPSKTELLEKYQKKYTQKEIDPPSIYAFLFLLTQLGKKDDVLFLLRDGSIKIPELFLGEILYLNRMYKEAIEVLKNEGSPYSKYLLARSFEDIGELNKASEIYSEIMALGASFPEIFLRSGMVFGRLGEKAKGFEYLGQYYLLLGRYEEARMYFEKAIIEYGPQTEEAKKIRTILKTLQSR